ncbi:GH3 auxin-responsive promoter family protein [Enhygromyxa salina]|uniref:GH3 auxin-responsive promoter n=1 Tax=Enhygromyxa salina TaxID=215803 RepID=A0A2S9YC22_9BACT|nr:GH3 auxin-responsive promoter family protein [Enhygromyxa salina]PRQ02649.1 GH3 auxin-responsive promoter [Enhygromyxa salina]
MSGGRGAASLRREIRDRARRERLATTLQALGDTEAGREFGLLRLDSFEDFRATVPLLDPITHAEQVTARLGFGLDEFDAETLSAANVERAAVRAAWVERLGGARPRRIAVLHAAADDLLVERMRLDDLRTLGDAVELLRINTMPRDPDQLIDDLRRFRADLVLMPSLATCGWLEQIIRQPLERKLPQLRWLMAEHDLDERVRSRLPVINAGWLHGAGRVGLPARQAPHDAFTLAVRSSLIELLPHGDPENDRRQQLAERTVLPEAAILGERYELVLSSPLGFLRLRSGLHVRVVGFTKPELGVASAYSLPCPRVVRLPPPPADAALEGVTLTGAWLTASVRQAFLPEDPALIAAEIAADPDAMDVSGRASRTGLDPFIDTELGASRAGSRRRGPKPRALVVRLEVQGQAAPAFSMQIAERIDLDLRRRSGAYDWLRTADELWEPRVVIAKSGTARKSRERRIRSLWGSVERPVVQMA